MLWGIPIGIGLLMLIFVLLSPRPWSIVQWRQAADEFGAQNQYLLSATAQVLAALFALIFSITLIAVQFVTKYTDRTIQAVFTNWIIVYMVFFAGSVIFPLWCFANPTGLGSMISVIIASVVIALLIPYFLYLRKRMTTESVMDFLKNEALRWVKKKEFKKAEESITALDNIAMGAYTDRNFEVFKLAERALAEFAYSIGKRIKPIPYGQTEVPKDEFEKEQSELHNLAFKTIADTTREVIDNPRAPMIIINVLEEIGLKCTVYDRGAINSVLDLIVRTENLCNQPGRMDLSWQCALALQRITDKATREDSWIQELARGKELTVYARHIEMGIRTWTIKFVRRLFALIKTNIGVPIFRDPLTTFLFACLGKFIEDEFTEACKTVGQEINTELIPAIFNVTLDEEYANHIVELLSQYSTAFISKGEAWQEVTDEFYTDLARIANEAQAKENHSLCFKAQDAYITALHQQDSLVSPEAKLTLAFAIPRQIVPVSGPKDWINFTDESRIVTIYSYLTEGVPSTSTLEGFWDLMNELSRMTVKMLYLSLEKGWFLGIYYIYRFYTEVTWNSKTKKNEAWTPSVNYHYLWLILASLLYGESPWKKREKKKPAKNLRDKLAALGELLELLLVQSSLVTSRKLEDPFEKLALLLTSNRCVDEFLEEFDSVREDVKGFGFEQFGLEDLLCKANTILRQELKFRESLKP